ncbi:1-acyl-sn-glycerol-3-phosphate acyltransferase [Arthrobacter oryzae]|uniref:1-acyl-sn-glycerol-3-phosphate acyltransferase n=1 Tax=Arthrobacter oryzae TaxID=409290 RepID=A0A3N0C634_9MICC|nr:lysophospholipid acyltransferase family protein [Arthrobacter oryzae]RNL57621.1 1-acyl-sn-glycerol-3-phosphate acyltransferase [Arthrobacter oryzae]
MTRRSRPDDRVYRFLTRTGLLLRRLFGIRVIVTGREHLPAAGPLNGASRRAVPGTGAVIAITHFGYLDFAFAEMLLWRTSRAQLRFLIHQGAADHWLARPVVSAAGHVIVPHGDRSGTYDAAVAKLRAGEYIGILPEAGVSRSFRVRECRTGAVRMAAEAGVPIIPVSVWGAHRLLTRHHGFSPFRAWRAPVRIHVGEPLLPEQLPGNGAGPFPDRSGAIHAATDRLRAVLQSGIDTATADFPLRPGSGSWWMPAHLGGGAPSETERQQMDEAEGPRRARGGRIRHSTP